MQTQTLTKEQKEYIKKLKLTNGSLIDLGTGSGCISIVLKNST